MLSLLVLLAAGALAHSCGSFKYWDEDSSQCLTQEECAALEGKEPRDGGFCRRVYEVSTQEQLEGMAEHPHDTCVLKNDIVISTPIVPIAFSGEIDGQGYSIKGIDFDYNAIYAQAPSTDMNGKKVVVGLFTNVTVVKNLGLEVSTSYTTPSTATYSVLFGTLAGSVDSLAVASDVSVSGSVTIRQGAGTTMYITMGGLFGEQNGKTVFVGPNVSSSCTFDCSARDRCSIAGLSYQMFAILDTVGATISSIRAEAGDVNIGGVAGYLYTPSVRKSFAELGDITVVARSGAGLIGGFVGKVITCKYSSNCDFSSTQCSDCYGSIKSITAKMPSTMRAALDVSPFIGINTGPEELEIRRCYGWLKSDFRVEGAKAEVTAGGLLGTSSSGLLRIQESFSIIEDINLQPSSTVNIGGLVGVKKATLDGASHSLEIQRTWTKLAVSSAAPSKDIFVGGMCGSILNPGATGSVTGYNVSVDITLASQVIDADSAAGQKSVAILVGNSETTESKAARMNKILAEYHCPGEDCDPVPLLGSGFADPQRQMYIVASDGDVTTDGMLSTAQLNVLMYGCEWEDMSDLGWLTYETGCPTQSTLPVLDRTGNALFYTPEDSTWTEWVLPDTPDGSPQLVDNSKCRDLGGVGLCIACEDGICKKCEGKYVVSADGLSCDCPAGFSLDPDRNVCTTTQGCADPDCALCGMDLTCLECKESAPYWNNLGELPDEECMSAEACKAAGGIFDDELSSCRKPKDLCSTSVYLPHCWKCPEVNKGETVRCVSCYSDWYVDKVSPDSTWACISEDDCLDAGGMIWDESDSDACLPMACRDENCLYCPWGGSWCTECKEGLVADWRQNGITPGKCIPPEECVGTGKVDLELAGCLALACAVIEGCLECDPANEEVCKACRDGWSFDDDGVNCRRHTCLWGSTAVPGCQECNTLEDQGGAEGLECQRCVSGWNFNHLTASDANLCISDTDCQAAGGMIGAAGDEPGALRACVQMSCSDKNCLDCFKGSTRCTECREGYLRDSRRGAPLGACVAIADCTGTSKPSASGEKCVSLACAVIESCALCGEGEEEALCLDCLGGYDLIMQEPGDVEEGGEGTGIQFCQERKAPMNEGTIAAIVFFVILLAVVGGALTVYFCYCKKQSARNAAA